MEFDESVKIQRELIYQERDNIIYNRNKDFNADFIVKKVIADFVTNEEISRDNVTRFILDNMTYGFTGFPNQLSFKEKEAVHQFLNELAQEILDKKRLYLTKDFVDLERNSVLKAIDECWVEEVDYLQQLRTVAVARQTAQRNPIYEYHQEAYQSFLTMKEDIYKLTFRHLLLSEVTYTKKNELQIYFV
ncbi:hypothetical protein HMPREF9318_01138 [Streptococcus urinalis FB127-CNA-2]|nr:hypothetical protein HMPREF9318_01138 [Streptococcus urinalis FB127-CNA-2]